MKKKAIIGGIFLGIIGLLITAWAWNVEKDKNPPLKKKRTSHFYRGLQAEPKYSKSNVAQINNQYAFDEVIQGDFLRHDFFIKNDSKEILELKKVKSCCGCIVEFFTRKIQPGQKGKISAIMITDKFGGRAIQGKIVAETNNQSKPQITIEIFLPVKEFAKIDPYKIILKGSYHQKLKGTSTVIPSPGFPFAITKIIPKKGQDIIYSYEEIMKDGEKQYQVTATNKRKKSGIYRDILFIQTDNSARPEFKIRVEGHISE